MVQEFRTNDLVFLRARRTDQPEYDIAELTLVDHRTLGPYFATPYRIDHFEVDWSERVARSEETSRKQSPMYVVFVLDKPASSLSGKPIRRQKVSVLHTGKTDIIHVRDVISVNITQASTLTKLRRRPRKR